MNIHWMDYLTVFGVTLLAALTVVCIYSFGVRLYAVSLDADTASTPRNRVALAKAGAYTCFALSAVAVLFGIYLIVPALHG
ncbi:hypothetical protein [Arthrobacter sp. zg-Y919]|uniref:hypothetical protein n=1 Tax=Arthrobacter sp. zg-Y919 TaxID=2894187 RepID=UPI001E412223|nr:hypothetical protein [Arthrobacter sp. zg-Y919]